MPVDKRSDIFSFGIVLYEMATGELPFQGKSALDTMHSIAFEDTRPIRTIRSHLPHSLQRIVDRCLHKEPEQRYGSALELAEDEVGHGASRVLDLLDEARQVLVEDPVEHGLCRLPGSVRGRETSRHATGECKAAARRAANADFSRAVSMRPSSDARSTRKDSTSDASDDDEEAAATADDGAARGADDEDGDEDAVDDDDDGDDDISASSSCASVAE